MSDNNGNGLFGGLMLAAGFTTLLMFPVVLMQKFGVHVMSIFFAIVLTIFAYFQPELIHWISVELQACTHCQSQQALFDMLTAINNTGLWFVAGITWMISVLILLFHQTAPQSES